MIRSARRPEAVAILSSPRLGEILVDCDASTPATVQSALKRQKREGGRLGEHLVRLGVPEREVIAAVARQLRIPVFPLETASLSEEALLSIDGETVRRHQVIPVAIDALGRLVVATTDPADRARATALAQLSGREVVLTPAPSDEILRAIDRHYSVLGHVNEAARRATDSRAAVARVVEAMPSRADAPIVQIVNLLLTQGVRDRVSDIHLEPQAQQLRVRYRVDGALRDVQSLPRDLAGPIASRVKIMASMDIVDRHRAQDGQFTTELDGRTLDVRVSTMETIWGEKVVLRVLDRSRSLVPLVDLGLQPGQKDVVSRLINSPYGMVIVSGPTGAGKTTSLYAALNELDHATRNVTTIEDPVEYHFADINQIQINRLAGITFANGLRAILRQDPDVILVGEVRDVETAEIAVQSALTGHLVLCSLHSADSVGAIYRFLDMGIEPFLIASALIGVVAQRLVRTLCDRCKQERELSSHDRDFYRSVRGVHALGERFAPWGCPRCGGTGYYDRTGVFEALEVGDELREMIVRRASHRELREGAVVLGMRSLQDNALDLVDAGRTTVAEVMRTVYII